MELPDQLKERIVAYLEGTLNDIEKDILLNDLAAHGIGQDELEGYRTLATKMDTLPKPGFPEQLNKGFYAMLRQESYKVERARQKWSWSFLDEWVYRRRLKALALTFSLFLVALIACVMIYQGYAYRTEIGELNSEVREVRTMLMLTLLDKESAIDRLKAVNISSGIQLHNGAVDRALLATLNNDPDVNVRLEAIDALVKRAANPAVRRGMVESISNQTSPLVQVTLADAMVALQEKSSADELRKLLNKDEVNSLVKEKLKRSIEVLM